MVVYNRDGKVTGGVGGRKTGDLSEKMMTDADGKAGIDVDLGDD